MPFHIYDFLIIDNCRVSFQNLFRLSIEFTGHFVDLVFLPTHRTSHAYSPTHAMYFEFFGAFFTFHDLFIRASVRG